jgi:hypothetical protein
MESLDIFSILLTFMGARANRAAQKVAQMQLNGLFSLVDHRSIAPLAKLSLKRTSAVVLNQF